MRDNELGMGKPKDVGLARMTHIQAAQVVTISTIKHAKTQRSELSTGNPLKSKTTVVLTRRGPVIVKSEGEFCD